MGRTMPMAMPSMLPASHMVLHNTVRASPSSISHCNAASHHLPRLAERGARFLRPLQLPQSRAERPIFVHIGPPAAPLGRAVGRHKVGRGQRVGEQRHQAGGFEILPGFDVAEGESPIAHCLGVVPQHPDIAGRRRRRACRAGCRARSARSSSIHPGGRVFELGAGSHGTLPTISPVHSAAAPRPASCPRRPPAPFCRRF